MQATFDYTPPKCCHCQGKQIKYDFQKPFKIPFIEIGGIPSLIRLKKRGFQCKDCHKVTVSETSLVQKNLPSLPQLCIVSLNNFSSRITFQPYLKYCLGMNSLIKKEKLAFIAQDHNTKKIITILDNRRQTTIRNHFFKYSKEAREGVKIVTMDMSGNYIPLIILLRSPVSRLRLKQSIPRLFHSQILKLFLTVFTLSNT